MSDDTRMMLLHRSTNELVEELLMWKSLAAEYSARIAELEAERRWTPVGERLPELDQEVLIYDQRGDITIDYLVALNREGVPYYTNSDDGALFWMPLPTLPEATHDR